VLQFTGVLGLPGEPGMVGFARVVVGSDGLRDLTTEGESRKGTRTSAPASRSTQERRGLAPSRPLGSDGEFLGALA